MTNGWTGSGDGTREQRHYYAQNWRADVSVIVDNAGVIQEWDKYRAYGVPFLLTVGDHTKDGVVGKDDQDSFGADYTAGNLRADLNKDGVVNSSDQTIFNASYTAAVPGGRGKLSAPGLANRKGYAGYEHDGSIPELAHVRHRVLHSGLGGWTRRDPLEYVDGMSLSSYLAGRVIITSDPQGLLAIADCSGCTEWKQTAGSDRWNQGERYCDAEYCRCYLTLERQWTRECGAQGPWVGGGCAEEAWTAVPNYTPDVYGSCKRGQWIWQAGGCDCWSDAWARRPGTIPRVPRPDEYPRPSDDLQESPLDGPIHSQPPIPNPGVGLCVRGIFGWICRRIF